MTTRTLSLSLFASFLLTLLAGACTEDEGPSQCDIEEAAYQCALDAGCGLDLPAAIALLECEAQYGDNAPECADQRYAESAESAAVGDCWEQCEGTTDPEYFAARAGAFCNSATNEAFMALTDDFNRERMAAGCEWQCGDDPI